MHAVDGSRKRKYITLEGAEVCGTAWYTIHGIPKSTYHNYIEKYKEGVVLTTHGNKGIKRPKVRTIQVTGTMKSIIDNNSDQMPHQMRGIGNGRVDTLKYLPGGNNWKRVQADANEVVQNLCLCLLVFRLENFRSHWLLITCLHSLGYLPILLNYT